MIRRTVIVDEKLAARERGSVRRGFALMVFRR
jgi:hypothetical protein